MTQRAITAAIESVEPLSYAENHPALHQWIELHEARFVRHLPFGDGAAAFEQYILPNGRIFVVLVWANKRSWSLFTGCESNLTAETLADANARLGLVAPGGGER